MKKGQKHSQETKRQMSISAREASESPQAKEERRKGALRRWDNYRLALTEGKPQHVAMSIKSSSKPKQTKKHLDELCVFWFTKLGNPFWNVNP